MSLRRLGRATFDAVMFVGAAIGALVLFAALTAMAFAPFVLMYAAAAWLVTR